MAARGGTYNWPVENSNVCSPLKIASSLKKTVKNDERTVDEKHFRRVIIGTFQDDGVQFFNFVHYQIVPVLRQNPLVAYKFCHLLHKVLREGQENVIKNSSTLIPIIRQVAQFMNQYKFSYGILVPVYCNLLITKMIFHQRNDKIPGNLEMSDQQLIRCADDKDDAFFQISIEMLDYLDWILCFHKEVFKELTSSRTNPMSHEGQCRLGPLIPCIQDAMQLHGYITKILYRLHAKLPPDLLRGHRERFHNSFFGLKKFHAQISPSNALIDIERLPNNPPQFVTGSEQQLPPPLEATVVFKAAPSSPVITVSLQHHRNVATLPISPQRVQRRPERAPTSTSTSAQARPTEDQALISLLLEKQRVIDEQRVEIEILKSKISNFDRSTM